MTAFAEAMFPRPLGLLVWPSLLAQAPNVYVMPSGHAASDAELRRELESFGHSVTFGVFFTHFDGKQNLAGVDVVYLQVNYNWGPKIAVMPGARWATGNYSVYSIKDGFETRGRGISGLGCLVSTPFDA